MPSLYVLWIAERQKCFPAPFSLQSAPSGTVTTQRPPGRVCEQLRCRAELAVSQRGPSRDLCAQRPLAGACQGVQLPVSGCVRSTARSARLHVCALRPPLLPGPASPGAATVNPETFLRASSPQTCHICSDPQHRFKYSQSGSATTRGWEVKSASAEQPKHTFPSSVFICALILLPGMGHQQGVSRLD